MAIDKWNGNGNWTGNPTDWSTGSPPGSTDIAEIQGGNDDLTTTTSVKSIVIDSGAQLTADTGAALTTTRGINNVGTFVTNANGTVTIGGTLTNSGTTDIGNGNGGLSASTTVTAAGLHNTGTLILQGNATSGTTNQATLDITAAAPATATGSIRVSGDAMVEFASGGITAVGIGASLELDGAQARVSIGSGTTSTALSGLSSNAGTLLLRGGASLGAGGATVATTVGFANAGTLEVDPFSFDGGSTLTIGGTLTNSGSGGGVNSPGVYIGNTVLTAATTVTATGLSNTGTVFLQGNAASGATNLATLNITEHHRSGADHRDRLHSGQRRCDA
jgi:fibronectin-binding autotransporter adhesin